MRSESAGSPQRARRSNLRGSRAICKSWRSGFVTMQEGRNARVFSPTSSCAVGGWPTSTTKNIETNEYIDFGELLPAKGKGRPLKLLRTSCGCPDSRPGANTKADSRLGHLGSMIQSVCRSDGSQEARKNSGPNGLLGESKRMACVDYLQSDGGNRRPFTVMAKSRAESIRSVFRAQWANIHDSWTGAIAAAPGFF